MKKDNKGFSLVELIIVIAIMAILVVVVAPQYLKYVERSRKSVDCTNVAEAATACQIWAAETQGTNLYEKSKNATITLSTSASAAVAGDNATAVTAALKNALGDDFADKLKLKSSNWTTSGNVTLTVTVDDKINVTVTQTDTDKTTGCDVVEGKYE